MVPVPEKRIADFEKLGFNTAISQMMIFVNAVYKEGKCPKAYAEGLIKMLSCICPHIGEEIWSILGHENTIAYEPWPTFDESKTTDDTVEVVVQVNGKVRAKINIPVDMDKADALAAAKAEVADMVDGKTSTLGSYERMEPEIMKILDAVYESARTGHEVIL